jgi:hypothetical protein
MSDFKTGDIITNGSSAGVVLALVAKDPIWKVPGVRVINVGLEQFNGNVGHTSFVPDYLLCGWRVLPVEWAPVIGGSLEERYVAASCGTRYSREVRKAPPTGHVPR